MKEKIGFIGLGTMGKWMALNMMKAGFSLRVYDINPAAVQVLAGQGAAAAQSPADVAAEVDWLFLSLPDTEIVGKAIFRRKRCGAGGPTWSCPDRSEHDRLYPHAGNPSQTEGEGNPLRRCAGIGHGGAGQGGKDHGDVRRRRGLFHTVRPAFDAIGNQIVYMGEVGSGQLTKTDQSAPLHINCAGLAEVLPMAVKLGLDPEKVAQVVTTGTGRSFAADFFLPLTLVNRFDEDTR